MHDGLSGFLRHVYCFTKVFRLYVLIKSEIFFNLINCDSGKASSIFVSDTISISRLFPINLTSDSNLFLIEFILRWPMIILCGFWFLTCLSLLMQFVFLPIIGFERGLSIFPETLYSTSSD